MKALIIFLNSVTAVHCFLPPNKGRFFYADVLTDDHGIHRMSLEIGSNRQNMQLLMALDQQKMSVVKSSSGSNIDSDHKYDPT